MKRSLFSLVLAVTFMAGFTSAVHAQQDLEDLFKTAQVNYMMIDTGFYSFPYEVDDVTITIYARMRVLYGSIPEESRTLMLWTKSLALPKNFNLSVPFLTALAQMNDDAPYGSYSLDKDKTLIYSNISLRMADSNPDLLNMVCYSLLQMRAYVRNTLGPYLDEG